MLAQNDNILTENIKSFDFQKYISVADEAKKIVKTSAVDATETGLNERKELLEFLGQFQVEEESRRKEVLDKIASWVSKLALTVEQEVLLPLLQADSENQSVFHRHDLPQEVRQALQNGAESPRAITSLIDYFQQNNSGSTSYNLVNLKTCLEQLMLFKTILPNVKPYFAVKTNPDPLLVRLLCLCGAGFDCASLGEIGFFCFFFLIPFSIVVYFLSKQIKSTKNLENSGKIF